MSREPGAEGSDHASVEGRSDCGPTGPPRTSARDGNRAPLDRPRDVAVDGVVEPGSAVADVPGRRRQLPVGRRRRPRRELTGDEVVAGTGVDDVGTGAPGHLVGTVARDEDIPPEAALDDVVTGATLTDVV